MAGSRSTTGGAGANPRGQGAQLTRLAEGQATTNQRLDEIFRRMERAEEVAAEGRDTAKELVTILREQNTGAKIVALQTELRAGVAELRQDFVKANGTIRTDLDALEKRVEDLETDRSKVVGVAGFFSWMAKTAPWGIGVIMAFIAGIERAKG